MLSAIKNWKKDFIYHITYEPERTNDSIEFKKNNKRHNIDFPAYAIYAPGTVTGVSYMAYYYFDHTCRPYDDGPNEIWYYPDGKIKTKIYTHARLTESGRLTLYNKNKVTYIGYHENGNKKTEMYYENYPYYRRNLHNLKGPAVTRYYEDGTKRAEFYFLDGQVHRKPHSEYSYPKYNKYKYYIRKPKEDINTCGPAKIYYDRKGKVIKKMFRIFDTKILNLNFLYKIV
jgi:hypothetical protein